MQFLFSHGFVLWLAWALRVRACKVRCHYAHCSCIRCASVWSLRRPKCVSRAFHFASAWLLVLLDGAYQCRSAFWLLSLLRAAPGSASTLSSNACGVLPACLSRRPSCMLLGGAGQCRSAFLSLSLLRAAQGNSATLCSNACGDMPACLSRRPNCMRFICRSGCRIEIAVRCFIRKCMWRLLGRCALQCGQPMLC